MIDSLKTLKEAYKGSVQHLRDQKILFDAKRENVKLQLEAEYRRRQMSVYEEARRRLAYLEARDSAQRAFEQAHMTDWIVGNVERALPSLDDAILKRCVTDLKALSQSKANAVGV